MPETGVIDTKAEPSDYVAPHWLDSFKDDPDYEAMKVNYAKYDKAENPANEAIKAGFKAQQKLGSSLKLPDSLDKLTDEQRSEFTNKVAELRGVPKVIEGFELPDVPDLPESMQLNPELVTEFKTLALTHKHTPAAVRDYYNLYNKIRMAEVNAMADLKVKQSDAATAELKHYWGEESFPGNCELITRHLRAICGSDEAFEEFSKTVYADGVENNSVLMKALYIGAQHAIGETPTIDSEGGPKGGSAQQEINRLQAKYPKSWERYLTPTLRTFVDKNMK